MKQDDFAYGLNDLLTRFFTFFDDDLHRNVLEIDSNSDSTFHFSNLFRISNSLEQYVNKEIGLCYVGFLGSYSSGKSSTINSLLNLWGTDKERKTNNNPTDGSITLITNQSNGERIFSFAKEGSISIRTLTYFENDFLKNIVLMDTPGSGDPNILESVVRDSLPLCDLIIYTLNITSPFTEIDRPFLEAQQSKLKGIPLIFVLTRADDYKKIKSISLEDENLNEEKFREDLNLLVARMNETIKTSSFDVKDFLLIDNTEGYNIAKLKERIVASFAIDGKDLIKLHNHKLNYFKNEIDTIYNYFNNQAKDKEDTCHRFISKAEQNIDLFNNRIEISKIKFKSLWMETQKGFHDHYNGLVRSFLDSLIDELNEIKPFHLSDTFLYYNKGLVKELRELSITSSDLVIRDIEYRVEKQLDSIYEKITEQLKTGYHIELNNIDWELHTKAEFPLDKTELVDKYCSIQESKIRGDYYLVRNQIDKFTKNLKSNKVIVAFQNILNEYHEKSIDVLESYFEALQMYNLALFAFEVRSYITDLGLAKKFEEIESGGIDKGKYHELVKKDFLDGCYNSINHFGEKVEKRELAITTIKTQYSNLTINSINHAAAEGSSEFSSNDIVEINMSKVEDLLNRQILLTIDGIKDELRKVTSRLKILRRNRWKKYLAVLPITLFTWVIVHFDVLKTPMPDTVVVNFIISLAVGLIGTLVIRIFDNYTNIRDKLKGEKLEQITDDLSKSLKMILKNLRDNNSQNRGEVSELILANWEKKLSTIFNRVQSEFQDNKEGQILSYRDQLLGEVKGYKSDYVGEYDNLVKYFNNEEDNLIKITNVADNIRKDAIEP
ncbi:MAG: GTPase, partial [Cytophagales bacterium]